MTPEELRNQFAMYAMNGILANDVCMQEILNRDDRGNIVAKAVADRAYLYADAMIERSAILPKQN